MTKAAVIVRIEEPGWRECGVDIADIRAAANRALVRGLDGQRRAKEAKAKSMTVLLAGDDRLRELNAKFRGKDQPTNVLSFPALSEEAYLGDIALSLGVAAREARGAGKPLSDHARHLTVHGVLHLLGYDHQRAREARIMERLEIAILHEFGIANPYAQPFAAE